ncbi:MAG TPA: thermonuclease family protein, partial [Azospirillum sp.]
MNCRAGRIVPLLIALLVSSPAALAGVRVASVLDGDTLTLDDGRTVRLAGIEAAKPPPGREEERRWPLAEGATGALSELALGRAVDLHAAAPDRYGRVLALLRRDDGVWLQDALLRRGLA